MITLTNTVKGTRFTETQEAYDTSSLTILQLTCPIKNMGYEIRSNLESHKVRLHSRKQPIIATHLHYVIGPDI
jgi:hypothetical protein